MTKGFRSDGGGRAAGLGEGERCALDGRSELRKFLRQQFNDDFNSDWCRWCRLQRQEATGCTIVVVQRRSRLMVVMMPGMGMRVAV